ncbi:MAG: hypothetical protein NXI00_21230 [Cytophagales bacterium]|nr:hypothetical protein [Cytophagales bacterium]
MWYVISVLVGFILARVVDHFIPPSYVDSTEEIEDIKEDLNVIKELIDSVKCEPAAVDLSPVVDSLFIIEKKVVTASELAEQLILKTGPFQVLDNIVKLEGINDVKKYLDGSAE